MCCEVPAISVLERNTVLSTSKTTLLPLIVVVIPEAPLNVNVSVIRCSVFGPPESPVNVKLDGILVIPEPSPKK